MITLSPCVELLFTDGADTTHAERIRRAAAAGFRWVEMWGWIHADIPAITVGLRDTGVRLNCLSADPSTRIVDPDTHEAFLRSIHATASLAAELQCPHVVVLPGDELVGVSRSAQRAAVVNALRRAAPIAEQFGVTLVLENLNTRVDHVGYFLDRTPEALSIIDEVDNRSVRMLYDLYHSFVMDESPAEVLRGRMDRVAHIQIADVPGRHEPGSGGIDWPREISWLVHNGYEGRIGLEYVPSIDTLSSIGYIREVAVALRQSKK